MQEQDTGEFCWKRKETVSHVESFEKSQKIGDGMSERAYARSSGVPRSTLKSWLSRKEKLDESETVKSFFESEEGLAFLHQLVLAMHFVFGLSNGNGLRQMELFLKLSRLSKFVASSFGSCQALAKKMEGRVLEYAEEQKAALSSAMEPKQISICQDETFHPQICLVAMEPVSGFIFLERYSKKRDGESWHQEFQKAISGLSVKVVQSTSDEGTGLLAHVKGALFAHHSPDLFHVQHELSKATATQLSAKANQASREVARAQAEVDAQKSQSLPHSEILIRRVEEELSRTLFFREEIQNQQELSREAIRGLGQAYHPFNLGTGEAQDASKINTNLLRRFSEIEAVAQATALKQRCFDGISKAKRVVSAMVATVAFFWNQVESRIAALHLSNDVQQLVMNKLLPAAYLKLAAGKAKTAEIRTLIQKKAEELAKAWQDEHILNLPPAQQIKLRDTLQQAAELFQRSSSCVEGRNGQLSLHHHSLHNLREKRLQALTIIHNYGIRRPDGTTAAERFFGTPPKNLFRDLLDHLDVPARPAMARSQRPWLN